VVLYPRLTWVNKGYFDHKKCLNEAQSEEPPPPPPGGHYVGFRTKAYSDLACFVKEKQVTHTHTRLNRLVERCA